MANILNLNHSYCEQDDLFYCYLLEKEELPKEFAHANFVGELIILDSNNNGDLIGIEILAFKRLFQEKEQQELKENLLHFVSDTEADKVLAFISSKK